MPLVFGIRVLIPPRTWYGARFNSGYRYSYLRYLVGGDFLHVDFGRDDYFGGLGTGHLWFILYLLVFSLAALPLWAGRHQEDSRLVGLSRIPAHPAGWLPTGLALLAAGFLPEIGGDNPFYCFAFFVLGYLALCSQEFVAAARRWMWLAIPLGVAGAAGWVASTTWRHSLADPSPALTGIDFLGTTTSWLLIVGLLGLGSRFFERTSPSLEYLAEGSYPVYILHQTVIVVLAFYMVGANLSRAWLWLVLLAASPAGTFLCYEVVRRWNWLRYLFGMHPRRGGVPVQPPAHGRQGRQSAP